MEIYTIENIRALSPCYDPVTGMDDSGNRVNDGYLSEGWTGTLLDILAVEDCPAEDRLWVVIGLLDDRVRRLLACQFARRTPLANGGTIWNLLTDDRSRNAVEVAERFANGEATEEELDAAWAAAWAIAWDASWAAAWAASRDASWDAAWAAAWAASRAIAWDAAWAASSDASWDAAWAAAWAASRAAQVQITREFLATYSASRVGKPGTKSAGIANQPGKGP